MTTQGKTLVAIVMGSKSDWEVMQHAPAKLTELGIGHEVRVTSAHRTPDSTIAYAAALEGRGVEVARTMVVNMFVIAEIFYLFSVRYLHVTSFTWRGALGTPPVLLAIAVLAVLQLTFTYAPFMHAAFGSRPLTATD